MFLPSSICAADSRAARESGLGYACRSLYLFLSCGHMCCALFWSMFSNIPLVPQSVLQAHVLRVILDAVKREGRLAEVDAMRGLLDALRCAADGALHHKSLQCLVGWRLHFLFLASFFSSITCWTRCVALGTARCITSHCSAWWAHLLYFVFNNSFSFATGSAVLHCGWRCTVQAAAAPGGHICSFVPSTSLFYWLLRCAALCCAQLVATTSGCSACWAPHVLLVSPALLAGQAVLCWGRRATTEPLLSVFGCIAGTSAVVGCMWWDA